MKKTLWIIASICLFLLISVEAYILFQPKEEEEVIPPPPNFSQDEEKKSTIKNFVFVGKLPKDFPQKLPLYVAEKTQTPETLAAELATRLGMTQTQDPATWRNTSTQESLTLERYSKLLMYINNKESSQPTETPLVKETTIQAAKEFINKAGLSPTLSPNVSNISYSTGGIEPKKTTQELAEVISIPFELSLEGYPAFSENSTFIPATIHVLKNNQVLKAEFTPMISTPVKSSTTQLLSMDAAVEELKLGKGTLIKTALSTSNFTLSEMTEATLETVSIEYRLSNSTQIFYPHYHFTGLGKTQDGKNMAIEIIVPAVKTQDFAE